jgi:hypothetical protein
VAGSPQPYHSFTSDGNVLSDDSSESDSVDSGSATAESKTDYAQEKSILNQSVTVTAPNSDAHWVSHCPQSTLIVFHCFLKKK